MPRHVTRSINFASQEEKNWNWYGIKNAADNYVEEEQPKRRMSSVISCSWCNMGSSHTEILQWM